MSVLQVYLSWANSVLCDSNRSVDSVGAVQDGKVLCELIDILAPEAGLLAKVQVSGNSTQEAYIQMALDHMKHHGVEITFSAQDIIDGDIKSLLDVLWLLIVNYGIHFIGQSAYQRSVSMGKKNLLEWCQSELETVFDAKNGLTFNLCTGNWFTKLLQKYAGSHVQETEDKVSFLYKLLQEIEDRYGIKSTIISPNDIIDGTVDEHTLMIYLSLLKRKVYSTSRQTRREMLSVEGKEAAQAKILERNRSLSSEADRNTARESSSPEHIERKTRVSSRESSLTPPTSRGRSHDSNEETSDWFSSSTGSPEPPNKRVSFPKGEQIIQQTISDRVKEHMHNFDSHDEKETDASMGHSEIETESLSEFSSSALDEGYVSIKKDQSRGRTILSKESGQKKEHRNSKRFTNKTESNNSGEKLAIQESISTGEDKVVKIKIKRPKDYFQQWEDTMDRLSNSTQPRDTSTSRSRSRSADSDSFGMPVSKRTEHFRESGSPPFMRRRQRYSPSGSRSLSWGHDSTEQEMPGSSINDRRKQKSLGTLTEHTKRKTDHSLCANENSHQIPTSPTTRRRSRHEKESRERCQNDQVRSNFMEQLGEINRSKAHSDTLLDADLDNSVTMLPGHGQEIFLMFDALRQARLDVDMNMPKSDKSESSSSNASKLCGSLEKADTEETDLKKDLQKERASLQDTSTDSIAKETAVLHRSLSQGNFSVKLNKSQVTDMKVLQRAHRSPSPATTSTGSSRYHSLSPNKDIHTTYPTHHIHQDKVPLADGDFISRRVNTRSRDKNGFLTISRDTTPTRRNISGDRNLIATRNFEASQAGQRCSTSPVTLSNGYRIGTLPSSSPYSVGPNLTPKFSPERNSKLGLPDDVSRYSSRMKPGGLGRVPRREAWERQRQKNEGTAVHPIEANSHVQTKFIEVLCKEIEELKEKIDQMEHSQSPDGRGRSPLHGKKHTENNSLHHNTGQNSLSNSYSARIEIQERDNKMMLARKEDVTVLNSNSPATCTSPQSHNSSLSSLNQTTSNLTHQMKGDYNSPFQSVESHQTQTSLFEGKNTISTQKENNSLSDSFITSGRSQEHITNDKTLRRSSPSPPARAISLGYKSPIRSVTQDIWGKDLTAVEGLEPNRHGRYKQLIEQRSLSEKDVIELKQALASAIVENDILQARLNNARHEIQDKLSMTNEVLDDCRRHLAKSQAENMELRSNLERERERADAMEGQLHDFELMAQQAKEDNEELEEELDHTLSLLDRSISETRPGVEVLKHENAKLQGDATAIQTENITLKREIGELQKMHSKDMNTIRDLHTCLDQAIAERNELQEKVSQLEHSHKDSKVKSIISHYQEKGAQDETEREIDLCGTSLSLERFPRSHHRTSTRTDEVASQSIPASVNINSPNVSRITSVTSTPSRNSSYSTGNLSPTVPSMYREIYPHRKIKYQGLSSEQVSSADVQDSPVNFIDYPDLQHYPTKLDQVDIEEKYLSRRQPELTEYNRSVRSLSRESSPIRKPIPYRPNNTDNKSAFALNEKQGLYTGQSASEAISLESRGRSPIRQSQSFRDMHKQSPSRSRSGERFNVSHNTIFDIKKRSTSMSPVRSGDSRKGILKNGGSTPVSARHIRDRSLSPHLGSRSHSPPTRLSPENKNIMTSKKPPLFTGTQAGEIAKNLQKEFEREDLQVSALRNTYRSKSWFELQLENDDYPVPFNLGENLGQEPVRLSEEQKRYANELIRKYTGIHI